MKNDAIASKLSELIRALIVILFTNNKLSGIQISFGIPYLGEKEIVVLDSFWLL